MLMFQAHTFKQNDNKRINSKSNMSHLEFFYPCANNILQHHSSNTYMISLSSAVTARQWLMPIYMYFVFYIAIKRSERKQLVIWLSWKWRLKTAKVCCKQLILVPLRYFVTVVGKSKLTTEMVICYYINQLKWLS